jgi:iron complex outermembrane recepter protein
MRCIRSSSVAAAVAAVFASSQPAFAQDQTAPVAEAPAGGIEEIVVTAQKRTENLQDVPLSVAAFSGETLAKAGIDSVVDLPRLVPNLMLNRGNQVSNLRMSIRGVGAPGNSAMDPSVGTFVDGIYVPRPGSLVASFNDMAGVEVLRGPQGTLFGRNATVGGILFRTTDPTSNLGGSVEAQAGNYGMQKYSGMINVPAGDKLSFRLAGLYDSVDGYAKNRLDGKTFGSRDTTAGRLGMKWDITDTLNWTVKVDYSKIGGDGQVETEIDPATLTATSIARLTAFTHGNPPDLYDPFDRKSNQRIYGHLDDKNWGVASNLSWDLAGGYTVRLLSGYRDWQNDQVDGDVVWTPLDLVSRTGAYDSKSQSYELQLISPTDQLFGGRLDYVAGLYYFQEDFGIGETLGFGSQLCSTFVPAPPAANASCVASPNKANAAVLDFNQSASNYAVYAQANVGLTDGLDLVLGGRWTKDDKSGSFVETINNPYANALKLRSAENQKLSVSDDDFTYRAGLNWKLNPDLLLFTSYSTGYKSGGFNSGGGWRSPTLPPLNREFKKETSDNIELGVKSTLADGKLRLNATAFRMNLNDFQDRAFDGTSFNVLNAGNLRNQGLEFDGEVQATDAIRLFGALGYLDSEFTKYPNASCLPYPAQVNPACVQDLKGKRPVYTPKYQGSVGAQVDGNFASHNLGYAFRTDLSYTDTTNINSINDNNKQGIQSSTTLLSMRYSLLFGERHNYTLSVFGDNLTDQGYCAFKTAQVLDTSIGTAATGRGLRDPVTGGTVMRCGVAPPRTYGVSIKAAF